MMKKPPVSSGTVRTPFGSASSPLRGLFGTTSVILRVFFGCSSGGTRTAPEHFPNTSRTTPEQVSNKFRGYFEATPTTSRAIAKGKPIASPPTWLAIFWIIEVVFLFGNWLLWCGIEISYHYYPTCHNSKERFPFPVLGSIAFGHA